MIDNISYEWYDLSPYWDDLLCLAEKRDAQKGRYKSTKNWSELSTHFIGLCGEKTFSLSGGYPLNEELNVMGDSGYDFLIDGQTYSIKTTRYWMAPHLKEYPNPKKWCDIYVLAGLDFHRRRCRICGWCEASSLQNATLVDYGYGYQRVIKYKDLNHGI